MISKKFVKLFELIVNLAFYTTWFPFKWNTLKRRLEPGPYKLLLWWWYFLCFANTIGKGIVCFVLAFNVYQFGITDSRIVLCCAVCCGLGMSVVIHYSLFSDKLYWRDMIYHINTLLVLDAKYVKNYKVRDNNLCRKCCLEVDRTAIQLIVLSVLGQIISIPTVFGFVQFEKQLFYLIRQDSILWNLSFAVLAHLSFYSDAFLCAFIGSAIICHIKLIEFWMDEIRWRPGANRHTKLRNLEYRQLQLIYTLGMDLLNPYLMPVLLSIAEGLVITLMFSAIKFGNKLVSILGSVMSGFVLLTINHYFTGWIKIFESCIKFSKAGCKEGKMKHVGKYDRKYIKTCWPFKFRVGSFFVVKKSTFMYVIGTILIPNVINLLVTVE